MKAPKKSISVLFVLPTLTAGGAERVMSYIAQNLDKSKFKATILVIGYESESRYCVEDVDAVFLNKSRVLLAIPSVFGYLRKSRPDIVMSAIRHMNVVMGLLSLFFPKIKFIGREVNVMSVLKEYPEETERSYPRFLLNLGFSLLDAIVCQSQDMLKDFRTEYPRLQGKLHLINNPITERFKPKTAKPDHKKGFKFITVGSLEPRKGHLRILKALAKLDLEYSYMIIGDGSEKAKINNLAQELNLQNKLIHLPFTSDVDKYLSESHIFLQGSYVEGFPNALLESCAVGTPVVAFKAPGGIDEIVQTGANGFIVENEEEFEEAVFTIINTSGFAPAAVSESVFKKYSAEIILTKYEQLFCEMMHT
ncbi:glycosyltransferase [Spongiimicrobium sp. 3-5]|uniref:glycosyltransferase n=1 Tax=Spongiimicrobium sp. 3-5 TaxID=3332596 RepID=UPI00397F6EA1